MPWNSAKNGIKSLLLAGVLVISVSPVSLAAAEPAGKQAPTPVGLYHHVWQLIKDHYYDPNYNGQNWSHWEHKYDKHLHDMADSRKAIDSMLASLADRYTRYLDPSAFDNETEMIKAKLCGIGIQMGLDKTHKLIVITPIEGTPAARAGLMPFDEILEIDGHTTNGLTVEQASKLIRGEIGTTVLLSVMRNKEKQEFRITRDEIAIRSVKNVMMLNKDVGYIRLETFMSERANDEMREALDKLSPARGIIIDLRNNPGGLVTNAIDICSMFLDGGIIVSTVDRDGHFQSARANGRPISKQALVLLINEGSASASEITSGAIHDSKRGDLVGHKSFGKGLVQSITRLEDEGGVNITIARYVTPNNIDIHKKGIVPDYDVDIKPQDVATGKGPWFLYGPVGGEQAHSPTDGKDIQLSKAIEVLNQKLQYASAPVEIKLSPFPSMTQFPNSLDSSGIGAGGLSH